MFSVKKGANYGVDELLNDYGSWIFFMKYFFDLFIVNKSNQSHDGLLILDTWKRLSLILKFKKFEQCFDEEMIVESQLNSNNSQLNIDESLLSKYQVFFASNSLEFVNNFTINNKNSENVR